MSLISSKTIKIFIIFLMATFVSIYYSISPYLIENAFIGHADEANMADLARNFAEGKGLVVNNVWLLTAGGIEGNHVTHPEPYWSIYVATIIAPFFYLFGATRLTFVIPAIIVKIFIVCLVAGWVWKITQGRFAPTISAIFISTFSPLMLRTVNGLSDIYLSLGILITGTILAFAIKEKSTTKFFLAGLFCGISIGLKPSGILLFGIWPVYFFCQEKRKIIFLQGIIFFMGAFLALTPYFYYNKHHFDTWVSPGIELIAVASKIRHMNVLRGGDFLEGHNRGFYDPTQKVEIPKNRAGYLMERATHNLKNFLQKAILEGKVLPLWLAPFVFCGIISLLWPLSNLKTIKEDSRKLMLTFCVLMIMGGLVLGLRVHFQARYWNFLFPLFCIIGLWKTDKLPKKIHLFFILFSLFIGSVFFMQFQWRTANPSYSELENLLPPNAVVLTSDPWQFAFHTRIPAVALPYSNSVEILMSLSSRYSAEYLVLFGRGSKNDARHEFYKNLPNNPSVDFLELISEKSNAYIYRIKNLSE